MRSFDEYKGIFPAFYACYEDNGDVSPERAKALALYLKKVGAKGLYVGGSSGECIYQSVEERKQILEAVMKAVGGDLTVIAHVACNNTKDSQELAAHAESLHVNAIASIPPIYFHLPNRAIAKYWNDISDAAPNTDFIIYNIPQLAGTALSVPLLKEMLQNPRCIGVKNSSPATQDIQMWRDEGAIVFNGPDEQLVAGLATGAIGGIGGTYGLMPELYIKIYNCVKNGEMDKARDINNDCCRIIYKACSGVGNMYAMIKEVMRINGAPDIGGVREPLYPLAESDREICRDIALMIQEAVNKYC